MGDQLLMPMANKDFKNPNVGTRVWSIGDVKRVFIKVGNTEMLHQIVTQSISVEGLA